MFRHLAHAARRAGASASASAAASTSRAAPYAGRIIATAVIGSAVVYSYDKESLSTLQNELFTRYALHAEAAAVPQIKDAKVDDATAVQHPLVLKPASAPDLALVGVGVRTVSFLKMKVYSAGFYVDDYTLKKLASLPGWAAFTADSLRSKDAEELVGAVLDSPAACAVRIVPVRNTDFSHLRDGLTRTLLARQKVQRSAGKITPTDDERLATSVQTFKSIFPAGSVPKGREMLLVRSADGFLHIEYDGRILGSVRDKWMADNMMLAYFDYINPISQPLRDSAAVGFEGWAKGQK